jgi:ABC-type antimicrobial peptide transport system permease subunit
MRRGLTLSELPIQRSFVKHKHILSKGLIVASLAVGTSILTFALERIITLKDAVPQQDYEITVVAKHKDWNALYAQGSNVPIVKLGPSNDKLIELNPTDMEILRKNVSNSKYVYLSNWEMIRVKFPKEKRPSDINLFSITQDYIPAKKLELKTGSWPTQTEFENGKNVMLIPVWVAKKYFVTSSPINKLIPFSYTGGVNGGTASYKIIGTFENKPNTGFASESNPGGSIGIIPRGSGKGFFYSQREVQEINLTMAESKFKEGFVKLKDFVLSHYGQGISVRSDFTTFETFKSQEAAINIILMLFSSGGLILSSFSITNLSLARVRMSRREIGMRAALGASKKTIAQEHLMDALYIGLLGGAFGAVLAGALEWVSQKMTTSSMAHQEPVVWPLLLLSLVLGAISSLIFSFYPAWEATRGKPAEILRQ